MTAYVGCCLDDTHCAERYVCYTKTDPESASQVIYLYFSVELTGCIYDVSHCAVKSAVVPPHYEAAMRLCCFLNAVTYLAFLKSISAPQCGIEGLVRRQ